MEAEPDEVKLIGCAGSDRCPVVDIVVRLEQRLGIDRDPQAARYRPLMRARQLGAGAAVNEHRLADQRRVEPTARIPIRLSDNLGKVAGETAGQKSRDIRDLPRCEVAADHNGGLGFVAHDGHGSGGGATVIERSCMPVADFLVVDEPAAGLQRLRAGFCGHAYDPHRHESYAVGLTEAGIQAFRYRGVEQASTPRRTIVLHPDELHDGHAVAPEGFVYRMLYVDAALIADAIGGAELPFVADAVSEDPCLVAVLQEAFDGFPARLGTLERAAIVAAVADALLRRAHRLLRPSGTRLPAAPLNRARELLDAAADLAITAEGLEVATGIDRYTLARAFRARFGTSPHRYLVGRRLCTVRAEIAAGLPLAEAAAAGGFADQSHMTRHFKARFGITPGRYARLLRAAG